MQTTASEVRQHEGLRVLFCPEWHAAALSDYCNDCRANPETQMPDFQEYAIDWLVARLADEAAQADAEAAQADAEAAQQRAAEREQVRQFPAPLTDEDDIPF